LWACAGVGFDVDCQPILIKELVVTDWGGNECPQPPCCYEKDFLRVQIPLDFYQRSVNVQNVDRRSPLQGWSQLAGKFINSASIAEHLTVPLAGSYLFPVENKEEFDCSLGLGIQIVGTGQLIATGTLTGTWTLPESSPWDMDTPAVTCPFVVHSYTVIEVTVYVGLSGVMSFANNTFNYYLESSLQRTAFSGDSFGGIYECVSHQFSGTRVVGSPFSGVLGGIKIDGQFANCDKYGPFVVGPGSIASGAPASCGSTFLSGLYVDPWNFGSGVGDIASDSLIPGFPCDAIPGGVIDWI